MEYNDKFATISVVINTLNEESNLAIALDSVRWADEIVICDMYSEDKTVDIAKSYGAKVIFHEKVEAFDIARETACNAATSDWVLLLDADEVVTDNLKNYIRHEISSQLAKDAYYIPRMNYAFGKRLKFSTWSESWDKPLRLFKQGVIEFTSQIHSFMHVKDGYKSEKIKHGSDVCLLHFTYTSSRHYLNKLNKYTSIEAEQRFLKGEKINVVKLLWLLLRDFGGRYILLQGFRDGWVGLYFSLLSSIYVFLIYAKLKELHTVGNEEKIKEDYKIIGQSYVRK